MATPRSVDLCPCMTCAEVRRTEASAAAAAAPAPRWADQVMNDLRMARAEEHALADERRAHARQLEALLARDKANRAQQTTLYAELEALLERGSV